MYKYSLHKKSKKHKCPQCKKNKLVLYVDNETGYYLSFNVGRCDREINCGYHFTPKSYFKNKNKTYNPYINNVQSEKIIETSYHTFKEFNESLTNYDKNNFVQFLYSKFDSDKVAKLLDKYKIGTAQNKYYGTIFWQVDLNERIKSGKVIWYDEFGKRTKYVNWVHSINLKKNKIQEFNLNQCFFGEHLLKTTDKVIAIVESEKTACIMSMLFDKYLWLASGSLNGLNTKKIQVLKNRKIMLYPDLGIDGLNGSPFSIWNTKCEQFKTLGFDIDISNLLESKGTKYERENGFDIADYFLRNLNTTPKKITTNKDKTLLKLYMKNKNLKTMIEVFDLETNINLSH